MSGINLRRLLLRGTMLAFWVACVSSANLFGQLKIDTPGTIPDGVVGTPYSQTLAASGGVPPVYLWSLEVPPLPNGLSLAPLTGVISGTPTAPGTLVFRVKVTAGLMTNEKNLTITIQTPLTITTPTALPSGTQGVAYSQNLAAAGGDTPYSWSVVAGTGLLPNGMSLSAGGRLDGTPTASGTSNFTVRVTDDGSPPQTFQKPMTIVIQAPLSITTASPLPTGPTGTLYSQNFAAAGGNAPYTWSLASAPSTLPAGLSLNAAGVLSGMPTAPGVTSNFTIRVTDGSTPTQNITKAFTLTIVAPVTITTATPLTSGITGTLYSQSLSASGGTAPYTWSLATGSNLPGGLSVTGATIGGTPTASGSFAFTIQATDSSVPPLTTTKPFTLNIALALSITTPTPLPSGVPGTAYSQSLSASGGATPYTWSLQTGSFLPGGLSISSGGVISGTPSAAGTSTFTIRVVDSSTPTQSAQKAFTLSIVGALTITTPSPLPSAVTGTPYSQTFAAVGGASPYTFSFASGSLPGGLTVSGATISGTPTGSGTSNFTIRVVDSSTPQQSSLKTFAITVGAALQITTTSPLPDALTGAPYGQNLAAAGGTTPYTWSFLSGNLPAGVTLTGTGAVTGIPSEAGTFNFTVVVFDSSTPSVSATRIFQLNVKGQLTITTVSVPSAAIGSSYSAQLEASGDPPFAWSRTAGALPTGINLSSTGLLSGTPTTNGTFDFTVRVTTASPPQEATRNYQIVVSSVLTVATTSVPQGQRSVLYLTALTAAGGVPPYSWSVSTGSTPPGLLLDAAGVLSGTPTDLGTFNFTARVADSAGGFATRPFTISVTQSSLHITTASLAGGIQNFAFSQQFAAVGGATPYTWSLASGTLPPGFAVTGGGTLQGMPTAVFSGTIGVRVTDVTGASDQQNFNLVIGPPLGTVSLSGLQLKTAPVQQMPITLSLSSTYPVALQGTLILAYTSTAVVPINDPAVQFSTGGRSVNFTIPANTANAVFPSPLMVATGTVTGTIALTGSIQNGPPSFALTSTTVDSTPPVITALTATRILGTTLSVKVTGFSPERRVTEVGFSFEVRTTGGVQLVNLSRSVESEFTAWFQGPPSAPFGSAFRFEQLFAVGGDAALIEAVTITVKNGQGTTTSARVPFTN